MSTTILMLLLLGSLGRPLPTKKYVCYTEISCPQNYMNWDEECFFVSDKKLGWSQARQYCMALQGDLVIPKSLTILQSYLKKKRFTPDEVWVGGFQDPQHRQQFCWVDGTPVRQNYYTVRREKMDGCLSLHKSREPALRQKHCDAPHYFLCHFIPYKVISCEVKNKAK